MTRPHDTSPDDQLTALLQDAVVDIEPSERLSELRARTAPSSTSRRWWPAAGGAVLAAAAAVTAIAVLGNDPAPTVRPGPADPPDVETRGQAVAVYFIGDTASGPRLYREFQPVVNPSPGLAGLALLESGPADSDYRSLWPAGSFRLDAISDPEASVVHVGLTDSAPSEPTDLALQQVVYTLSAGFQEPLEVVFHQGGARYDLGPVVAEATAAPRLEILSLVNLSDPFEGQLVSDTLVVRGVANSFEANVPWTIEQDGAVVDQGTFTAEGYMAERLFPFSGEIDVSSLDPGTYTLIVETDDPSGGAEGNGPFSDTRTFVLE